MELAPQARAPFFVHVDESQNLGTDTFASLRSEGWAASSAPPGLATMRESDITPLLLQDLMTSPYSADSSSGPS